MQQMAKVSLVEVFRSVQGEGFNTGRDAIFIRLAGCPLACEFAPGVVCDTPYQHATLKLSLEELFGLVMELFDDQISSLVQIKKHDPQNVPMVVLTGGEPTAAPSFDAIARAAYQLGFYVAVETNGTQWREGLDYCDWVTVSPKEDVPQTSQAQWHNKNPQSPKLHQAVIQYMEDRARSWQQGGEYRYVIGSASDPIPPFYPATRHYLSPAIISDGSGEEWKTGFPGFVPGAVQRCLDIIGHDPRWRLSLQTHKFIGVR